MPDSRSPRSAAYVAGLIVISLVAAACGNTDPSPSASVTPTSSATSTPAATSAAPSGSAASPSASAQDTNAILDAIERQVESLRKLDSTVALDRAIIDEDQLRVQVTKDYDKDTPPAITAANERLYKALGLLPADANLRTLSLDLLSAGVAGFYRDDEKKMYVVSRGGGVLTPADEITYAHEFTHALQAQHWPVFKDQDGVFDRSDWILARQAIYEGDATLLMTYWAQANLSAAELAEASKTDPAAQAVVDKMPAILRDTLLYPYTTGAFYVLAAQGTGGWPAVDAFYDRMPTSTEQILHPDAYANDDKPVDVQLPAGLAASLGSGWSVPLQDTFGELQLGIWLTQGGVVKADADAAAAGWGGDRLAVIDGPGGAWSVAMHTVWDTEADAKAFEKAATTALAKSGGVGEVLPGVGGTTRWVLIADGPATLDHVAGVLGLAG